MLKDAVSTFNSNQEIDEFSFRRIWVKAEECLKTDPADGAEALGFLSAVKGDIEGVNQWFRTALAHSKRPETPGNYLRCIQHLGHLKQAADLSSQWFASGSFSQDLLQDMVAAFAISGKRKLYHEGLEKMREMNVGLDEVGEPDALGKNVDTLLSIEDISEDSLELAIDAYVGALVRQGCRIRQAGWHDVSQGSGYAVSYLVVCVGNESAIIKADMAGVDALVENPDVSSAVLDGVLFRMEAAA